jgi:predicted membrane channel-forming protein YqfA (hemolysin III family)
MLSADPFEKRLQLAGIFLILGLLVEAFCLVWKGPLAFLVFLALGGILLFAGIVAYLFSLVSIPHPHD